MNPGNQQVALYRADLVLVKDHSVRKVLPLPSMEGPASSGQARAVSSLPLLLNPGEVAMFELAATASPGTLREFRSPWVGDVLVGDSLWNQVVTVGIVIHGLSAAGKWVSGSVDAVKILFRDSVMAGRALTGQLISLEVEDPPTQARHDREATHPWFRGPRRHW